MGVRKSRGRHKGGQLHGRWAQGAGVEGRRTSSAMMDGNRGQQREGRRRRKEGEDREKAVERTTDHS